MVFGRMATAPSYAVGRSTLGEEVSSNQEVQTIPFPRATNDQRRNNSNGMVKYGRMGGDGILWVTHTTKRGSRSGTEMSVPQRVAAGCQYISP